MQKPPSLTEDGGFVSISFGVSAGRFSRPLGSAFPVQSGYALLGNFLVSTVNFYLI